MKRSVCALAGADCRPLLLRWRASRPQLKRDPLGGALPPHKHPFGNSFCTVSTRGAARRCSRGKIRSPRRTPHGRATGMPHRARPRSGWLPTGNFPIQRRARALSGARRARALVESAPSNMRLKLAGAYRLSGTGVLCPWRGTDFVQRPCAGGRVARSLSAIR